MANFNTHVCGATAGSCLLATLCQRADFIDTNGAFVLAFAGIIGGILPDIDLKYSHPSKIVFTTLGLLLAMLWVFATGTRLSIIELWVFGLLVFLFIRYPLWAVFHQFTVHRGSFHSVAAALMFGVLAVVLADHIFRVDSRLAWLTGVFVMFGYILHLSMDEIYSVDFLGRRLKRSFGSALKLVDFDRLIPSALIILIALTASLYTPSTGGLITQLLEADTYSKLLDGFLPDGVPEYINNFIPL